MELIALTVKWKVESGRRDGWANSMSSLFIIISSPMVFRRKLAQKASWNWTKFLERKQRRDVFAQSNWCSYETRLEICIKIVSSFLSIIPLFVALFMDRAFFYQALSDDERWIQAAREAGRKKFPLINCS